MTAAVMAGAWQLSIIDDKIEIMESCSPIYTQLKEKYSGKKVLVVGLGVLGGGEGVAKFFAEIGAVVTVTDKKPREKLLPAINRLKSYPINYYLNHHPKKIFLAADLIIKGPFVPWDLPQIIAAQKKGIPITMELSFFTRYCPATIIGITGSRGKTTTTMMIYQILKQADWPVHLAGNLPQVSTISLLKSLTDKDWVVMELPSWPLSDFHRQQLSPHIGVFTNFSPDHLNYYKTINDYFYDKTAIYRYQKPSDYLIANIHLKDKLKNIPSQVIYFKPEDFRQSFTHLVGNHNRENAAAALTVAKLLNLNLNLCLKTLANFSGVPFRQQVVGRKKNIVFVNDTTATTPVATISALKAFSGKNIVLILGGNSKNLPYADLIQQLNPVKKIVLLSGSFTDEILPVLQKKYPEKITVVYDNLEKAIGKAYDLALNFTAESKTVSRSTFHVSPSSVYILFSPAATSFAMFSNEFHRGEEFNRVVKKILSSNI